MTKWLLKLDGVPLGSNEWEGAFLEACGFLSIGGREGEKIRVQFLSHHPLLQCSQLVAMFERASKALYISVLKTKALPFLMAAS